MKTNSPALRIRTCVLLSFVTFLLTASLLNAWGDRSGVVAVYSSVSPTYSRAVLPSGGFKAETYAFGEGGDMGGPQADPSIDKLRFLDIARLLAPSLADQKFIPSNTRDPRKTDLLIMVYWGTTAGSRDLGPTDSIEYSLLLSPMRKMMNWQNAKVLGYLPELIKVSGIQGGGPLARGREDLEEELEENRYFVVLMAYDFQKLWKNKQRQMLWQTRFSIRSLGHSFDKELASISQYASRYYGQDTDGLLRKRFAETNITIGDSTFLKYESESTQGGGSAPAKKPSEIQ